MSNKSAAFIPSAGKDASVLRARDVREGLQGRTDPEVVKYVCQLAEINHVNTKAIAELATMFNSMVDVMNGFQRVAGNMKDTIQKMGSLEADVEGDVNTDERMN